MFEWDFMDVYVWLIAVVYEGFIKIGVPQHPSHG